MLLFPLKLCLLLALFLVVAVDAFLPPRKILLSSSQPQSNVQLFLAGNRGGTSRGPKPPTGQGKKVKKTSNTKQKGKSNSKGSTSTKDSRTSSSRASQLNNNNKKPSSSVSPPWQVVSQKDLAKNVQAEKERRKLAQQGIHNVEDDREYRVSKSFLSLEDKSLLAWKRFAFSPTDEIDFIGAYLNQQLPPRLGTPEVAFLGRSNVGKSSLLNKLVGSPAARVGKTPGATASVNLYGIFRKNKPLLGLVDLPGFGYAKLSKESKESVQVAAEKYLGKRKELALGILLVDSRRVPSDDDRAVLAALYDMGVPIMVVATKMDKLSKNELDGSLEAIRDGLGLPEGQPFCVSSVTGDGIKDLWKIILEACEDKVDELKQKLEGGAEEEQLEAFEESEDIAYDQGYDWVHDSASVMYEGDEGDFVDDFSGFEDDEDRHREDVDVPPKRETLRELRKRARDMELRGEL